MNLVGFVCNGAPMSALNLAGLRRLPYPPDVRFIRVDCAGRLDQAFILKLLEEGTDGILILGCHREHCRHYTGSEEMERRAERLRSLLTMLGWPPQRVESRCLTPSDDADLADLVTRWAGEIEALGPNPRRRESSDGR